jgi:hypothetical protein
MVRSHFARLVVLALALAFSSTQPGWSDDQKTLTPAFTTSGTVLPPKGQPSGQQDLTCSVYALGELADDANFGKWIADTIPQVIQPGSWSKAGVSYYAPARILVVRQTPPVQAKVAAFLQDLKKALPAQREQATARSGKSVAADPHVIQSGYTTPSLIKTADAAAAAKATYPVPAAAVQPKHLFHLIIRYEGDGLTDANVAALVNGVYAKATGQEVPEDKAKTGPSASAAQLSQLFQFIVRYEGEGIIDSNVAELLKTLYGQKMAGDAAKAEYAVPATTAPAPTVPERVPAPKDQPPSAQPQRETPRVTSPAVDRPAAPVPPPAVRSGQAYSR